MERRVGLICALASSTIWGLTIIYWKALASIDPLVVTLYRVFFVAFTLLFAVLIKYSKEDVKKILRNRANVMALVIGGILISAGWGINIWGVKVNEILQISLGFYLEPVLISAMGIILLKEMFKPYLRVTFLFALAGIGVMAAAYGRIPLFALGLAGSYAAYALVKRKTDIPVFLALFFESALLLPLVIPLLIWLEAGRRGALAQGQAWQLVLLLFIGVVTAAPLGLFAIAARKASFTVLGMTAYIDPTIILLLGIFLYKEAVNSYQLIGRLLIWLGLMAFTIGQYREHKTGRGHEKAG